MSAAEDEPRGSDRAKIAVSIQELGDGDIEAHLGKTNDLYYCWGCWLDRGYVIGHRQKR